MYTVETIMDKKIEKKTNKELYFIKWEGYDISANTWEPIEHLSQCHDLVDAFNEQTQYLKVTELGLVKIPSKNKSTPKNEKSSPQPSKTKRILKQSRNEKRQRQFKQMDVIIESQQSVQILLMNQEKGNQQKIMQNQGKQNNKIDNIELINKKKQEILMNDEQIKIADSVSKANNVSKKNKIQVLGMKKNEQIWEFYIRKENNEKMWFEHGQMIENYPQQLCLFYQKNLVLE